MRFWQSAIKYCLGKYIQKGSSWRLACLKDKQGIIGPQPTRLSKGLAEELVIIMTWHIIEVYTSSSTWGLVVGFAILGGLTDKVGPETRRGWSRLADCQVQHLATPSKIRLPGVCCFNRKGDSLYSQIIIKSYACSQDLYEDIYLLFFQG